MHGACWASPLTTELYSELNCIPSPLQMIPKPTLTSYLLTQGHINMYPHIQGPQNIPFYLKKKICHYSKSYVIKQLLK